MKKIVSLIGSVGKKVDIVYIYIYSFYGGNAEVTRDEVLLYKYRMENPIRLFDENQRDRPYKPVEDVAEISPEFVTYLNEKEYSWDDFRFHSAFDIDVCGDLDYILSRLAASYVTVSDHLASHFSGTELENHRNEMDALISRVMDQQINVFSDTLGDFLETNGFAGEKDKIRHSIENAYSIRSSSTVSF